MLLGSASRSVNKLRKLQKKKFKWDFRLFFFLNMGITVKFGIFYLSTVNNLNFCAPVGCRVRVHARLQPPSSCNKKNNKSNWMFWSCFSSQDGCCHRVACLLCRSWKRTTLPQASAPPKKNSSPHSLWTFTRPRQHGSQVAVCWTVLQVFYEIL